MPLEFKLVQKFKLTKNNFNKKCAPKPIFLILKNQKDADDFCCRKLTLNVRFWHFLTLPHNTSSQNSLISFDYN